MNLEDFTKPYDTALFALSVLKRLGGGDVETFNQRLVSQKKYYLAQVFGIVPMYRFNLYLRGPYSPDLSHDLFKAKNDKIEIKIDKFVSDQLEEQFKLLKCFIKDKTARQLELIVTLHWFKKINLSSAEARKKLIEMKNADNDEIKFSFEALKQIP